MEYLEKSKLSDSFLREEIRIWTRKQILTFIAENRDSWSQSKQPDSVKVPNHATSTQVLNALLKQADLQRFMLDFPYRAVTRFAWKAVSTYEVIQSVDPSGYFSHYSAVRFHDLQCLNLSQWNASKI